MKEHYDTWCLLDSTQKFQNKLYGTPPRAHLPVGIWQRNGSWYDDQQCDLKTLAKIIGFSLHLHLFYNVY